MTKRIELTELERKKLSEAAAQSCRTPLSWRDIDTAPKDGTRILVCSNGILQEGVHRLEDLRSVWVGEVFWEDDWYGDPHGGWMIANCDEEYGAFVNATHWQPLPEPPQGE